MPKKRIEEHERELEDHVKGTLLPPFSCELPLQCSFR